jgi:hypothetical protein
MSRLLPSVLLLVLLLGCGAGGAAGHAASPTTSSAAPSTSIAAPPPTVSPSGPATPRAGETAAAFWARRGVTPPPPAGFLDAYAGLPLPASEYVRAAVRELSGETYATDHLRLDLVDSGVLGTVGLSGDQTSIEQARAAGLASTTTTIRSVLASRVVTVPTTDSALGTHVVALTLRYGPFVGHYADGTSKTLGAPAPLSIAVAGRLVTAPLLGTFLYVTSEVDCSSAVAGSVSATACTALAKV